MEIVDENCRWELRMEIAGDPHSDRLALFNKSYWQQNKISLETVLTL